MPASIHPYKGYLNTNFRIYVTGDSPISYKVFNKADKDHGISLCQGTVFPNEPYTIKMPYAGVFEILFENDTQIEIYVEDGYKYGGNKLKTAFVFDNCPWVFVVMHDRTYFYNRENLESYVEAISPDMILEVSDIFVLFENKNQDNVVSLYSLVDQKPILWIKNVIFYNSELLCWSDQFEDDPNRHILYIYSLHIKKIIHRILYDSYIFDNESQYMYYQLSESIYKFELLSNSQPICVFKNKGKFVSFIEKHYAVFFYNDFSSISIYDVSNSQEIGVIPYEGKLARINGKILLDIWSKYLLIKNLDLDSIELPEATISCTYSELDIYPCVWGKCFYTAKTTYISSYKCLNKNIINKEEKCFLKSLESNYIHDLQEIKGEVYYTNCYFLFYNAKESIVIPRYYPHRVNYRNKGTVHKFNNIIILHCEGEYCRLSNNGFWDKMALYPGEFDFSEFESFGVAIKEKDKISYLHAKTELGRFISKSTNQLVEYLLIGNYRVYEGGIKVVAENSPQFVSRLIKYGLTVDKTGVYWGFFNEDRKFCSRQILDDLYDTSEFMNVLLDESGKQILYRDNNTSMILDIVTGRKNEFKNLSYINHINGIRPFVRIIETSQAILINPIDGQPIDFKLLTEYQFVSPDHELYADKALDKYIEYYNLIICELISKEDYLKYVNDFDYPYRANNESNFIIRGNRLAFINQHYVFLIERLKEKRPEYEKKSKEDIIEMLLSEWINGFEFVNLFIEKRGVAVIRRISDNSEIARIALGIPLWYLNYVAFSKDSKYVAIAGRYPNGTNVGGLFLVYDLKNMREIVKTTNTYAIWTVAFSREDAVAAYTSYRNDPVTFFANHPRDYEKAASEGFKISHYNFLTFSPDGKLFACSQQGYIPYRKRNGEIRENWGHQPSSLVSIRLSHNPSVEILAYHDLSEMGIADTMQTRSVASVSFSNDNSRIMMVGKDGTVIVRNLNYEGIDKKDESFEKHNNDVFHNKYGITYGEFEGTYAQNVMGFSDDVINDAFEGEPDACLNID